MNEVMLDMGGCQRLAAAIILQACFDYADSLATLKKYGNTAESVTKMVNSKRMNPERAESIVFNKVNIANLTMKQVEDFMHGEIYAKLCTLDPDMILAQVRNGTIKKRKTK